ETRDGGAGARFGKRAGSRGANGVGSEPVAVVAAVADGKFAAGGGGRGGWVAAGGWGAAGVDGVCSRGPGSGAGERGEWQSAGVHRRSLRRYRNYLRVAAGAAGTAVKSRGRAKTGQQRR